MKYETLAKRLDSNSLLDGNGCWVWTGNKSSSGYGRINMRIDGKHRSLWAHRIAFEEYRRPLEFDEEVDHICCNRSCINPDHLQAVTRKHNLYLRDERRRQ